MEKQIERQEIYNGKVIHVVKDEVELDDGTRTLREVVIHNGGVCIALRNGEYREGGRSHSRRCQACYHYL